MIPVQVFGSLLFDIDRYISSTVVIYTQDSAQSIEFTSNCTSLLKVILVGVILLTVAKSAELLIDFFLLPQHHVHTLKLQACLLSLISVAMISSVLVCYTAFASDSYELNHDMIIRAFHLGAMIWISVSNNDINQAKLSIDYLQLLMFGISQVLLVSSSIIIKPNHMTVNTIVDTNTSPMTLSNISIILSAVCSGFIALLAAFHMMESSFKFMMNTIFTSNMDASTTIQHVQSLLLRINGYVMITVSTAVSLGYVVAHVYMTESNFTHDLLMLLQLLGYMIFQVYLLVLLYAPHRTLAAQFHRIQDELESKSSFLKMHMHDLRTPLSTVIMGLDLLSQHFTRVSSEIINQCQPCCELNDDLKGSLQDTHHIIDDIQLSSNIAVSELSDLLFYDQVKTNQLGTLDMKLVDAWQYVNECIKPFYIQANAAGITINVTCEHDIYDDSSHLSMILIDESKLKQVIRNLLSNALKFSPKPGNIQVILSKHDHFSEKMTNKSKVSPLTCTNARDGVLRVEVVDQGPGISIDNQRKMFHQYVQIDPNLLQGGGGSGLGLWSAREVVREHDGSIGVVSEGEGHGSLFFFELPCYKSISNPSTPCEKYAKPPNNRCNSLPITRQPLYRGNIKYRHKSLGDLRESRDNDEDMDLVCISDEKKKLRVLIVDDSLLPRKMVQRCLKMQYIADDFVCDGDEAIDMVKSHVPHYYDIILLDYMMPKMNGCVACKALRDGGFKGLIVGLTASMSLNHMQDFTLSGANAVMVKPLKLNEFNQLVTEWKSKSPCVSCNVKRSTTS